MTASDINSLEEQGLEALNAIFVAKKVFADRGLRPVTTEGQ
jgi:hypothetical protein